MRMSDAFVLTSAALVNRSAALLLGKAEGRFLPDGLELRKNGTGRDARGS